MFEGWTAKDWLAFVIGAGLIAWGLSIMIGVIIRGVPISEKSGEIFAIIATGLVSTLALHFGKLNGK